MEINQLPELPLGGSLYYEAIVEAAPGEGPNVLIRDMESGGSWLVRGMLLVVAPEDLMDSVERMVLRYRKMRALTS